MASTISNRILVFFDMLIDTDYGIVKYVRDTMNAKYIKPDIYKLKDEQIFSFVTIRNDSDIMKSILKEPYHNSCKSIYNELMESDIDKIFENSVKTNVFNLLSLQLKTKTCSADIICKNIKEEHFIKSIMHDGNMRVITISDFSKIYTEKYDTIFIKNAEDIKNLKGINGKNIYVGNYEFNYELPNKDGRKYIKQPLEVIANLSALTVSVIDMYNINEKDKL